MTEKEVEGYLEGETRVIPWKDGHETAITQMKVVWSAYDFLIKFDYYTPQRIAELAAINQTEVGGSYEENFRCVVGYAAKIKRG